MVHLETQRLLLQNFELKDLEKLYAYRNDDRCARFQRWEARDRERDGLLEMIHNRKDSGLYEKGKQQLAIAFKKTDELVGDVTIFLENPTITLGYTIDPAHQQKGFAFELLSELTKRLHEIYEERELICLVEPENLPSIGLLKKLGFEDLGYAAKIESQIYGKWPVEE